MDFHVFHVCRHVPDVPVPLTTRWIFIFLRFVGRELVYARARGVIAREIDLYNANVALKVSVSQGLSFSRSQGMGSCCGARHKSPPSSMPPSLPPTPPEWIPPPPSRPVPRPDDAYSRISYLFERSITRERLETLDPQHLLTRLPPRDSPNSDSDNETIVQLRPGYDL